MDVTDIFERFRVLPGSGQIASAFALEGLAYWLTRQRPRRVLEIGAGIGTCSEVIRRWMIRDFAAFVDVEAVCVENNPWCRGQWAGNLQFLPPGMRLVEKIPNEFFDFVILDGPQVSPADWAVLTLDATIFMEGGRRDQCRTLSSILAGTPFTNATWRPPDRTKGFSVFLRQPTWAERRWFLGVQIREWCLDLPLRLIGQAVGKRRS